MTLNRPQFFCLIALALMSSCTSSNSAVKQGPDSRPAARPAEKRPAPEVAEQSAPDVLMLGRSADDFVAPKGSLQLLLGQKGGTYYQLGVALARQAHEIGLGLQPLPSFGSVENLYLVALGQADAAFVQLDLLENGSHKLAAGAVDILSYLFTEEVHLVVRMGSKIHSLKDLKGKTVHFGTHGSGTAFTARTLMRSAGLDPDQDCDGRYGGLSTSLVALAAGELDAVWVVAGAPLESFVDIPPELLERDSLGLVNLKGESVEKALSEMPGFQKSELPAETYYWFKEKLETLSVPCVLVVNKELSRENREKLMKAVSHGGFVAKVHAKGQSFGKLKWDSAVKAKEAVKYSKSKTLRLLGAQSGGTYDVIAAGLCRVAAKQSLKMKQLKTNGSFHNLILLASGEADCALVQRDVLHAVAASKTFAPLLSDIRLISPLFNEEVHLIVRRGGPVKSVQDLQDKRIHVGLSSSGTWWTVQTLLKGWSIDIRTQRSLAQPALMKVLGGELDGMFLVGGSPMGLLADLPVAYKEDLVLLDVTTTNKQYPVAALPKGIYRWTDKGCKTVDTEALLIGRRELSGRAVAALVAGIFAHKKNLLTMHPKWAELTADRAREMANDGAALRPHAALRAVLDNLKTDLAAAENWGLEDTNTEGLMPGAGDVVEMEGEQK
jgi:uncharacterized protein